MHKNTLQHFQVGTSAPPVVVLGGLKPLWTIGTVVNHFQTFSTLSCHAETQGVVF